MVRVKTNGPFIESMGISWNWVIWVAPLMMPISYLLDMFLYWGILWRYYTDTGKSTHKQRVEKVQDQVIKWRAEGQGLKMCTTRPSYMSISQQTLGYKKTLYGISVDLHSVLEIDKKNMRVKVEPSVTIGFLNRLLVSQGYTLPIVPELDMLTIGGLIMGGGIESTSHKYGLFHHICTEYELVIADGSVITANAKENDDIYHGVAFSYGTLGFLTAITIKIVPFKPYVKINYKPTYSLDESCKVLDTEATKATGNDSVEGILFSKETAVIMTGNFVEERDVEWSKVNRLGLWYKPWFYRHVQTYLEKGEGVEYVPTLHFHQRHNKPMFWLTHLWLPWAHNPIARFLTGWILPLNTQVLKYIKEAIIGADHVAEHWILQDFIMPMRKMKESILFSDKVCPGIWPIWACPTILFVEDTPVSIMPRDGDVMYVDIGVYGLTDLEKFEGRDETIRKFEKFALDNNGYQALYAETLMSNEEFREMFVRTMYEKARNRIPYCKQAFPDVYEKISRDGRRGIFKENGVNSGKAAH